MLGRKTFTQDEIDRARATIDEQLAAYRAFAATSTDDAARAAFEAHFFGNLLLVLDRFFVHRVRLVTGKGRTPPAATAALAGRPGRRASRRGRREDDERVEREPYAGRMDTVGVVTGERADGRVQLHDGAGHAGEVAQLDDAARGPDLDVVADPGRDELRICHARAHSLRGRTP
jgi:hypothetical protein